jgi:protein suppressor of PHYA-105 1
MAGWRTQARCQSVFRGHANEKNFVGLAVSPSGYIACGSENNRLHLYHHALPLTVATHQFGGGCTAPPTVSGTGSPDAEAAAAADVAQVVSSACWASRHDTLLAANSAGCIKVLELV